MREFCTRGYRDYQSVPLTSFWMKLILSRWIVNLAICQPFSFCDKNNENRPSRVEIIPINGPVKAHKSGNQTGHTKQKKNKPMLLNEAHATTSIWDESTSFLNL